MRGWPPPVREAGWVAWPPAGLSKEAGRTAIVAEPLHCEQQLGVNEIAQRLHTSKVTLSNYLRHRGVVSHNHRKTAATKATE